MEAAAACAPRLGRVSESRTVPASVTSGGAASDEVGAYLASCPRTVIDDDRLAEACRHGFAD